MTRVILVALITSCVIGTAMAQSCESKAVSAEGKPLHGAAKTSFVRKCKQDACESKAKVRKENHFTERPKIALWRNARSQLRPGRCPLWVKSGHWDTFETQPRNVRFVPKADICRAAIDRDRIGASTDEFLPITAR